MTLTCRDQDIIVVGGGIAGLAAGQLLHKATVPKFIVLEASGRLGGRIKQAEGLADWPIELGPEFIHGAKSSLMTLINQLGCQMREKEWPDYWYFGQEGRLVHSRIQDADVAMVMEMMDNVGQQPRPEQDLSARQWLLSQGANDRMVSIADACYATDFGCSIDDLGLREMIIENQHWDSGDTYLLLDRSLQELVQHLARPLQHHIEMSWPVHKIQYGREGAVLHGPHGRRKSCRQVLVTASLAVLQRGDITFEPPLPEAKQQALSRLKMTNAIKVILMFSQAFWPADLFDVVCTDSFIPEFWITSYPVPQAKRRTDSAVHGTAQASKGKLHAVVGFITGRRAVSASSMAESAVVQQFLQQLDRIFGSVPANQPATDALVKSHIADWSKEPYVGGCYSHPSLGAHLGDRLALAESVQGTVFFAGEATHAAVNPCLQAAFETGEQAAREMLSLQAASRL